MKTLLDGKPVVDRAYFYLHDWNLKDEFTTIRRKFGVVGLESLNHDQFWELFKEATKTEFKERNRG